MDESTKKGIINMYMGWINERNCILPVMRVVLMYVDTIYLEQNMVHIDNSFFVIVCCDTGIISTIYRNFRGENTNFNDPSVHHS